MHVHRDPTQKENDRKLQMLSKHARVQNAYFSSNLIGHRKNHKAACIVQRLRGKIQA
jgi:hypothetical protein